MKKLILVLVFLLTLGNLTLSQSIRSLNFECGGYVTEIYPAKNTGSLSSQILYARTDIGGVYKSTDNGISWNFISTYFREGHNTHELSQSELCIQGLAVNPNNANDITICWGNNPLDASNELIQYQCLWKSTNGGNSWNYPPPSIQLDINGNGLIFFGNSTDVKLGGECIIYFQDDYQKMLMGGAPTSYGQPSYLYYSSNGGSNWKFDGNSFTEHYPYSYGDTITTIAMHSGSQQIWVGTTMGIFMTTNLGASWNEFRGGANPSKIKRIILKGTNENTIAFVTYGNTYANGIGKFYSTNSGGNWIWQDLTSAFDENISSVQKTSLFSTLCFPKTTSNNPNYIDENHLIAGRYGRPIRESTNDGINWSGYVSPGWQAGDYQTLFYYPTTVNLDEIIPRHQFTNEFYILTGMSNLTQNLYHPEAWYSSGGAGAFKSEDVQIFNNNNQSFSGSHWNYMVNGNTSMSQTQNMVVVYDVSFDPAGKYTLIPLSDWTMAATNNDDPEGSQRLNFDRRIDELKNPEYIPNVTRALFSSEPSTAFIIGGDVYNHFARMYKRTNNYPNVQVEKMNDPSKVPWHDKCDRALLDGVVYKVNENTDRIVVLLGSSIKKHKRGDPAEPPCNQNYNDLGVYYSDYNRTTSEYNFSEANFAGYEGDNQSSQSVYQNAVIGGSLVKPEGFSGDLFSQQFNFANNPNFCPHILYIYLEGGGIFKSSNGGTNWEHKTATPNVDYLDEGCMKFYNNILYLAIKNHGLFRSTNNGDNWDNNAPWEGMFSSAEQVEIIDNIIFISGKMSGNGGDLYNKIYMNTNNGIGNWTSINTDIPGVRSMRAKRNNCDVELWLSTSGQGVQIIKLNNISNTPWNITNHFIIENQDFIHDCDNDIVVKSGGFLEIKNCQNFKMKTGKKIKVDRGGKLVCDGVSFDCINSNELFGGIELFNYAEGCEIKNCVFNNASIAISLSIDFTAAADTNGNGVTIADLNIENNTFNISVNGSIGVYGNNVYNVNLVGNTFNISSSNTQGVVFINTVRAPQTEETSNQIYNNTFYGGSLQLSLTGLSSQLSFSHIENNTMSNSEGVCLIGRMITGTIKNNHFQSNGANTIQLIQSDPYLLNNEIVNSGRDFCMTNSASYPILAPISDGEGNFNWVGGTNILNSYNSYDIKVKSGYPIIDYGENKFRINTSEYFHIQGKVDDELSDTYYCRNNCWEGVNDENPLIYIWNNDYVPLRLEYSPNSCTQQISYNGYFLKQQINNRTDTIFTSINNSGNSVLQDEINFANGLKNKETRFYSDAINNFKSIINNYPESKYLNGSLIELYACYEKMDTLDINNRIVQFTILKNYISQKLQEYQNNYAFTDVAYNLLLMTKVYIGELNDAADGYQFLSLNHPEPERRLLASMDYESVLEIMGNSGGEKEDDKREDNKREDNKREDNKEYSAIEKNVERLITNDTLAKITSINYNKEKSKIKLDADANKLLIEISKEKKFDEKVKFNLVNTKNLSKERKDKNRIENIMLIAGIKQTGTNEKSNTIPTKFELYQNYPNPFNPTTKIAFDLPKDARVKLIIYDILGREIKTIMNNEFKPAGKYINEFNGSQFASGVYFARLLVNEGKDFIAVKKLVLVK